MSKSTKAPVSEAHPTYRWAVTCVTPRGFFEYYSPLGLIASAVVECVQLHNKQQPNARIAQMTVRAALVGDEPEEE